MALGIAESITDVESSHMWAMVITALAVGSFFAVTKIPNWLAALSIVCIGLEYLLLFWGSVGLPAWNTITTLGTALTQPLRTFSWPPNFNPVIIHLVEINQALQVLVVRFSNWSSGINQLGVVDPLIPQLVWGVGIWLSVAFMARFIWRGKQALLAALPAAVLLGAAGFFSSELYNNIAIFMLCLLILQAASQGLQRQSNWVKNKIDTAESLAQDLATAVIPLSIAIVGLAFTVPTISVREIAETVSDLLPWNDSQTDAVASSFGLRPAQSPFRRAGLNGLPRSHLLGDNPELGRQTVMRIYTGEFDPVPYFDEPFEIDFEVPHHYWQAATYDNYNSYGWILSGDDSIEIAPEITLGDAEGPGRVLQQRVERGRYASNLLHTSGTPLSVDMPVQASYRGNNDLVAATLEGESYIAQSWLVEPTPDQLRAAGTDYPTYISDNYLHLPRTLPTRVRSLALEVAARAPTSPYDKALELENYLREFPYNLDINKPPSGSDITEYFLFELQEGYCDYYATTMTVMARAIGLPARFVVGYVTGSYDPTAAAYIISEAEAHSWTQIYFPDIGWVNFEPTAGRPAIVREVAVEDDGFNNQGNLGVQSAGNNSDDIPIRRSWWRFNLNDLPPVHPLWWGVLVVVGLFVIANFDFWRLRLLKPEVLSTTLYQRLLNRAEQAGLHPPPGDTPYEFAHEFTRYLFREIPKSRLAHFRVQEFWRWEIHAIDEPTYRGISQLADQFVRQQYAPPERFPADRDALLSIWEELGPELNRATRILWLTRRYPNWFDTSK
jgi:transglutaminase-like putative cysteine protease